jgi:CHAD domain-containing protein
MFGPYLSKCAELESRVMPRFDKWLSAIPASATVDQVARRALGVRLRAVAHFLDAAVGGQDENEGIHQLRIWTRRAAAALRLFRPALPAGRRRRMKQLLRKLRRRAGAVRDADVHLTRLQAEGRDGPQRVIALLKDDRRHARRKLRRLRGKLRKEDHFAALIERLLDHVAWPKRHSSRTPPPFAPWCREELAPLGARYFELAEADLQDDAALHELRIAGKRLRYLLELSVAALKPQPARLLEKELSEAQDRLGEICDFLAAIGHLQEWIATAKKHKQARKLHALLAGEQHRQAAARKALLRWWTPARRARLQRLWKAALAKRDLPANAR